MSPKQTHFKYTPQYIKTRFKYKNIKQNIDDCKKFVFRFCLLYFSELLSKLYLSELINFYSR